MSDAKHQEARLAHLNETEMAAQREQPTDESGKVIQLNLGAHARNSARDYVEVSVPDSVKTFMTLTPTAQLDKMALDNERMFEARYGFKAGKAVRMQVIDMQRQYDLTDSEVTTLRKAGQLSIRPKDQVVRVGDDMVGPVAGGIYLFLFTAVCLSLFIDVHLRTGQEGKKLLASLLIAGMWVGVIWYAAARMIGPWHMIRLRIRQMGKTMPHSPNPESTES